MNTNTQNQLPVFSSTDPLTNRRICAILSVVMNLTDPHKMILMAESLEETAKALRQSAALFQQMAAFASASSAPVPIGEQYLKALRTPPSSPPTVRVACIMALQIAGRPLHINDLFKMVKDQGAVIGEVASLSSMLSRDQGATFETAPETGKGFWRLAVAKFPVHSGTLQHLDIQPHVGIRPNETGFST